MFIFQITHATHLLVRTSAICSGQRNLCTSTTTTNWWIEDELSHSCVQLLIRGM